MSKIKNNPLLKGASGMLGDVVVYRQVRGKVIMANRPKKNDVLTNQQRIIKSRFLRAVQYAKRQMEDSAAKAEYATGINDSKISAYAVALTDYLSAPVIDTIDTTRYLGVAGDTIAIKASDDFKVVSVYVTISASNGDLIEQGEAVLQLDSLEDWRYTTTVANATLPGSKITVAVRDKPGNVTSAEKAL